VTLASCGVYSTLALKGFMVAKIIIAITKASCGQFMSRIIPKTKRFLVLSSQLSFQFESETETLVESSRAVYAI